MSAVKDIPDRLQLIRASDLCRYLRISSTTLWRWRRQNLIPQPLSLGPRMIGWHATDIHDWLEAMKQEGGL